MTVASKSILKPSRVAVVGRNFSVIERALKDHGFYVTKTDPQMVVSFGGDGTLLYSERLYPSVPKIRVRHDSLCGQCQKDKKTAKHPVPGRQSLFFCRNCFPEVASKLAKSKRIKVKEYDKIQGQAYYSHGLPKGQVAVALNELSVHHQRPQQALRGNVMVNGKDVVPLFVADGVLVATAYGSSGYFYSCTRKKFSKGIGIALVNPVRRTKPVMIKEAKKSLKIRITLSRRHGLFYADNSMHSVHLDEGDYVDVRPSEQKALFVQI